MRKAKAALMAAAVALGATTARAQANDPAAQQVDALDRALLGSMKAGKSSSAQVRYQKLAPTVQRTFDFKRMIRFASGAAWTRMTPADQSALALAFGRFTIASYAHNFDSYAGQKFVLDRVDTRLPDKLVRTELVSSGGASVVLSYRMQQDAGAWRVIDVYFNGSISELAQQSSDFASTLAAGGAPALTKKLNDQSEKLLSGA